MFRSIRWRITLPFAALISLVVLTLGGYLTTVAQSYLLQDLQDDLLTRARLLSGLLENQEFQLENAEALDATAQRWAQDLDLRITIIGLDGTVLGESDGDRTLMENHANRPEVQEALETGRGRSTRFSRTLGFQTLYVALPVLQDDHAVGVVRLSLPLDQVQASVTTLQRSIILAALVATVLAVLLADTISRRIVRPLRDLTEDSRNIAAGERSPPQIPNTRDEVEDLARALNQMSEQLRGQIDALEAEREKLSTVLHQMESGVLMVDPQGEIVLINQAAERIFGIDQDTAMGRSLVETLRLHRIVNLWQKANQDNTTVIQEIDLINQRKSLQVIATPLGGVLSGNILLILQDVTHIRRLETIRRDFITNISHELRTPLASLKALTETLLDGALDDPPASRRFLTRIETEVDSLSLMVQELLELTRIESGRVPLEIESTLPITLIQGAVERLQMQAERAGLVIDVQCDPGLPQVNADVPRMQQVLMNLLHNAIKFTPAGGSIDLFAYLDEGGQVVFGVHDTGVGISADDLSRIFERFYKADRSRSGGGTGLGLAISKHLVEAHGGRIWAESVEGRGSTFFLVLPVSPAA